MKKKSYTALSAQAKIVCLHNFIISCLNILFQIIDYGQYIDVGWSLWTDMLPFCIRLVLINIFGQSLVLNYSTGGNYVLGFIHKKFDLHLEWLKL